MNTRQILRVAAQKRRVNLNADPHQYHLIVDEQDAVSYESLGDRGQHLRHFAAARNLNAVDVVINDHCVI